VQQGDDSRRSPRRRTVATATRATGVRFQARADCDAWIPPSGGAGLAWMARGNPASRDAMAPAAIH
jgi:hypothetical protein